MAAIVISGKELAKSVYADLKQRTAAVQKGAGRAPCLAVVLVGENPASKVYVSSKAKRAHKLGIDTVDLSLPASTSNEELQAKLRELSADGSVDGILLQLPLPDGLDEFSALLCIAPEKDVDGLHPYNQGLLLRGADTFAPCTPKGCIELVKSARAALGQNSSLSGLHAVVLGRSILVGKPAAALLLAENCTVTQCHSRTKDLAEVCRGADILVAAVGRPNFVRGDWVKPGSIVIDVGINRLDDGSLAGDVCYDEAQSTAAAITPVPGGVGPMTIAMLMANTVRAAEVAVR
ncbi:MAG: bifunctional 5,10-methylenetetrahydrofolate dehydrogenase/5,10-methenyltetrahydrofolate cyclohydrolase [Bdellovibrionales bacterium]|nr:bifunctional 5,10-methylenetetrahydrofolate dehydrogenase/5,10-methenyltetrahydrofolate cyclohydrolase [Bdellovibrionales bacterium]